MVFLRKRPTLKRHINYLQRKKEASKKSLKVYDIVSSNNNNTEKKKSQKRVAQIQSKKIVGLKKGASYEQKQKYVLKNKITTFSVEKESQEKKTTHMNH